LLKGEKILVTGPAGSIASGLTRALARDNEVWGIARFSDAAARAALEQLGVTTRSIDLAGGRLDELPRDFTYVVHMAVAYVPDYDHALRVNAEGTGFLLAHCRSAKAALVMSTCSVYKPHPDPWHGYAEDDALGDSFSPHSPPYSVSKIAQEGVARYCARSFGLPVTVARMNCFYGSGGGLPLMNARMLAEGRPVETRWDPYPFSPIHASDIEWMLEPLLAAASVPATIVNWGGDEVVAVQEWCAQAGALLGADAQVAVRRAELDSRGMIADSTKRKAITGPCRMPWKQGFQRELAALYPERVRS
jgi:nucleoside-diphosphate-sugar epimerase